MHHATPTAHIAPLIRRLTLGVLLAALCLWALGDPATALAKKPKKPTKPAISKPKDQVELKIAWSLGSDRRGQIFFHICSLPFRNADAGGGCKERDILDELLIEHQGDATLPFREGIQYNVCFVAIDTFNRPGTWGACQIIRGMDGVTFRFNEDMFEFWYGGQWQDQ
jgi:hypothetical protein